MSEMIYGIHAVQALLERAPERFQEVFILKGREDKRLLPLIHALESQGVVIQLANRQYLDEKSDGAVHQGIIARVKPGAEESRGLGDVYKRQCRKIAPHSSTLRRKK